MTNPHPLESNTPSSEMPKNYEVVVKLEVMAKTPEQAATIARDIMLDPDSEFHADVHKIIFCEEAWDSFPDHSRGWQVSFGGTYHEWQPNGMVRVTRKYSVTPLESIRSRRRSRRRWLLSTTRR
jgi:hypothetical protein